MFDLFINVLFIFNSYVLRSNGDESNVGLSNTSLSVNGGELKAETPNVKKRHRRIKSSNIKNQECEGKHFLHCGN